MTVPIGFGLNLEQPRRGRLAARKEETHPMDHRWIAHALCAALIALGAAAAEAARPTPKPQAHSLGGMAREVDQQNAVIRARAKRLDADIKGLRGRTKKMDAKAANLRAKSAVLGAKIKELERRIAAAEAKQKGQARKK